MVNGIKFRFPIITVNDRNFYDKVNAALFLLFAVDHRFYSKRQKQMPIYLLKAA